MKLKTLLVSAVALLCSAASWAETDVTSTYLTNADFSSGTTGWTGFGNNKNTAFIIATNDTFGKGSDDKNAEMFKEQNKELPENGIKQTIRSLPAGVYRLTVNMRSDLRCYLYAKIGDKEQHNASVKAVTSPAEQSLIFIVHKTGSVEIGFRQDGTSLNTWNWIAVDDFKLYRVGDIAETELTSQIANWDFTGCVGGWGVSPNFPGWTVYNPNSGNAWAHNVGGVDTAVEYYIDTPANGIFDYYQTISGLPNGKYTLSASMWNTQIAAPSGECGVYGTSSKGTVFKGVTDDCNDENLHTYTTDGILVPDGELRVGVKNNTTMAARWFGVDWIKLTYIGNEVSYYSPTTFTNNTSATGETWYAFNIEYAGTYKVESSNTATIYYTQDDSDDAANTENAAIAATGFTTIGLTEGTLYFKSSTTSTIKITSLVLDGTYYLYNQRFDRFYSRGSWWGTRAVADIYGTPVILTTNATNSTTIKSVDNNGYIKETAWLYTDGNSGDATDFKILVSTVEGYEGYQFANNKLGGTNYLYVNASDLGNGSYGVAGNSIINDNISDWNQTVWQLMSISDHNTKVDAYPITNKTSVIEASGISTTAGDLETYLSSNYVSMDKSALISAISSNNAIGSGWTWNTTRNGNARTNDGYPSYNPSPYASLWKNTGFFTYTVSESSLPAGIYKLVLQGFDRRQNRNSEATLYETYGNIGSSYLEANGQKVRIMNAEEMFAAHKTADPSWTINREWAGQLSSLDGNYAPNTVYVYLDGNTDLNLTIEKPDCTDDACLVIGSISMTYYNLNTKAIIDNKGDITSKLNSTFTDNDTGWSGGTRISDNSRTWHGNVINAYYEVNASHGITDGKGTMTYTVSNMPAGTYKVVAAARGYDGGSMTPQIAGTSGTTLACIGDTRNAKSSTEINTNGVEFPYSDAGGFTTNANGHNWQWISATGTLASAGDLVINFNCVGTAWMAIDDVHLYCTELDGTSYTYTVDDDHLDAGDKVVTADIILSNPNAVITSDAAINGAAGAQINNNLVGGTISNMVLYDGNSYTSPAGEYAITNATYYRNFTSGRNATVMIPFTLDATTKEAGTAYTPTRYANDVVLFTTVEDPAADVPYVFVPSSDIASLTGARTSASEGSKQVAGTSVTLYGTYATTPIEQNQNNYVASNNMLWLVDNAQNSNPFRAYLHVDAPVGVKSLSIRLDDATGIQAVEGSQSQKTSIYNLAGQRLNKLQKGINIVNGKKVLVK